MRFSGFVDDAAVLSLSDKSAFRAGLEPLKGCEVEGTLERKVYRRKRTYEQLKYWFGVPMKILSAHTGYTKMQMHYLCLAECFGVITDAATGREVPVVPASRHLTTKHFSDLIEWVGPWAAETFSQSDGTPITIPLPGDVDMNELPGVDENDEEPVDAHPETARR